MLPLALATGAGAGAMKAIGTAVTGGMLSATFIDLFYIPLFFVLVTKAFKVKRLVGREGLRDSRVEFDRKAAFDFDTVADEVAATMRAGMADYHVKTMVDMTACELGRHPRLIAEVARRSGLQILAITGFFPERIGIPYHWKVQHAGYIRDHFLADLTEGMAFGDEATDIKAGAIKIATVWATTTAARRPTARTAPT